METGTQAGGVLVVEAGDAAAFARQFLPMILALADHGLRGDRDGVYQTLRRLRADLTVERSERADRGFVSGWAQQRIGLRLPRTTFDDADVATSDLIEKLDLVMQRAAQAAEAERVGRPGRIDILLCLRNIGTITDAEYLAALELRAVGEAMACLTSGAAAIDYTRVRVDGGSGWSEPELSRGFAGHPASERVLAWARYVATNSPPVSGRSKRTPLQVIWSAVGQNVPLSDIDRTSGIRKGTAAKVVKAGLGLYVAMHGAALQKAS